MKSQIIIAILVLLIITGCSKKVEKIYYPSGELKEKIALKDGLKNGEFKSYYKSGQTEQEGIYVNDKREGVFTWYYENGQIDTKVNFVNNVENGELLNYYKTGILKSKGNFNNGKQDGLTIFYYPDGKIKSETEYRNGVIDGSFKEYYTNGQLLMYAIYEKDSVLYFEKYDENGNFLKEYREVFIEPLRDNYYVGEPFKAKISISGPLGGKEIMIVPFIRRVDKVSGMFKNEPEIIYESSPIKDKGIYTLRVNYFVDSICYHKEIFINVLPKEGS